MLEISSDKLYIRDESGEFQPLLGITSGGGIAEIPIATKDILGGIKVGNNLTITSDGVLDALSVTKDIIEEQLGYVPADVEDIEQLTEDISSKVDKVNGKGLSANDFTNELKTKLDGIEVGANKTTVDETLSATSTNPVQNKAVNTAISTLNDNMSKYLKDSTDVSNKTISTDLNDAEMGLYRFNSSVSNNPFNATAGYVETIVRNATTKTQIAYSDVTGLAKRVMKNGTWGEWIQYALKSDLENKITTANINSTYVSSIERSGIRRSGNVVNLDFAFVMKNVDIPSQSIILTGLPLPYDSGIRIIGMDTNTGKALRFLVEANTGNLKDAWNTTGSLKNAIIQVSATYIAK